MKNSALILGGTILALMGADRVIAEEKAHEHGHGKLNIAVGDSELEAELIAPGADIVGFEHAAETDADKAAVRDAVVKLKNAVAILGLPKDAMCEVEEVEVESELLKDDDHDHDHDHDAHKDDDHKHDDHKHDDDHKDHAHDDGEQHAEFHVHYHIECAAMDKLTALNLGYFETFPNARELDVQAITAKGQISEELTPKSPALALQ